MSFTQLFPIGDPSRLICPVWLTTILFLLNTPASQLEDKWGLFETDYLTFEIPSNWTYSEHSPSQYRFDSPEVGTAASISFTLDYCQDWDSLDEQIQDYDSFSFKKKMIRGFAWATTRRQTNNSTKAVLITFHKSRLIRINAVYDHACKKVHRAVIDRILNSIQLK